MVSISPSCWDMLARRSITCLIAWVLLPGLRSTLLSILSCEFCLCCWSCLAAYVSSNSPISTSVKSHSSSSSVTCSPTVWMFNVCCIFKLLTDYGAWRSRRFWFMAAFPARWTILSTSCSVLAFSSSLLCSLSISLARRSALNFFVMENLISFIFALKFSLNMVSTWPLSNCCLTSYICSFLISKSLRSWSWRS